TYCTVFNVLLLRNNHLESKEFTHT
ncbi:hypothetical protein CP082626L3_0390B, partial [Chlamydia psittaci 08-2626_L3]